MTRSEMPNCIVHMEKRAILDLSPDMFPDSLVVTRINVPEASRGEGIGSWLLRRCVEEADEHRVKLRLEINPTGPLDYDALHAWYERYGFEDDPRYLGVMVRWPAGHVIHKIREKREHGQNLPDSPTSSV